MKILLLGKNGQVGWELQRALAPLGMVVALDRGGADGQSYKTQITYVTDRPGHDRRYAIDARKIERKLGWKPAETFDTGIRKTVQWYLDNPEWVAQVQSGAYREWVQKQYQADPVAKAVA